MQFYIYTYQFKPIYEEPNLFNNPVLDAQEAMEKKNKVFSEALETAIFTYRNKRHNVHFIIKTNDLFIFKISNPRKIVLERSFHVSEEVNEPSIFVIINNDSKVQRMAIQQDVSAFTDTNVVAKIISNSILSILQDASLQITIRREYSRNEFWDIVKEHTDMITSVTFQFDYPNLPRVRSLISDMLKDTSINTRSNKTILAFEAEKDKTLCINENDANIQDLNNGAADCGTQVTLGIKGLRKKIKTGHSTKEIDLSELQIMGDPEEIKDILKNIV